APSKIHRKQRFSCTSLTDGLAVRLESDRAAWVAKVRIGAAPVDAHDVRLVLDRPRLQEGQPMLHAGKRPTGDHDHRLRPHRGGAPEMLGKTQVIADERSDPKALPVEALDRLAGGVVLGFLSQRERLHLVVTHDWLARG